MLYEVSPKTKNNIPSYLLFNRLALTLLYSEHILTTGDDIEIVARNESHTAISFAASPPSSVQFLQNSDYIALLQSQLNIRIFRHEVIKSLVEVELLWINNCLSI